MSFITPTQAPQAALVRQLWESEDSAGSQGNDGQLLSREIENVFQHWIHRSSSGTHAESIDHFDELHELRHVPFESVGRIQLRFTGVTDLSPRVFEIDDEDDE